MIYMYIYFVLTSINLICSCFVHVQQHAPHQIVGMGHPCHDKKMYPPLYLGGGGGLQLFL